MRNSITRNSITRNLLTLTVLTAVAGSALAFDLDARRPDKPTGTYPVSPPSAILQGGDTIIDAVVIGFPYHGSGTTVGYVDDYDEICPYSQSTSPDVVYSYTPPSDDVVHIDLLGSTYDTKLYVYDSALALIACNDDYYPDYVSRLEFVPLAGGETYFIVIDGYGGDSGYYEIAVTGTWICPVECPPDGVHEGEPPLVDQYVDDYNGGCGSENGIVMQPLDAAVFCGVSGWYLFDGMSARDTDWLTAVVPASGVIEIIGSAEYATYLFELGPQDCAEVGVIQNVVIDPCIEGVLTVSGEAGSTVWVWVGPTSFEGPVNEYDYLLVTNLGVIAAEDRSWSGVKALFD